MRCLSPPEVEALFTIPRFSVSLAHSWYRSALQLDPEHAVKQFRLAFVQPSDIGAISRFVTTLNRWLPNNRARLLWVDHWEVGGFGALENALVAAAWRGLGETRSPAQAPGLLFDAHDCDEQDQLETSQEQQEALGLMTGIIALMMITGSDGWLIAPDCTDRVEFWEGNFFFHSESEGKLKQADEIMTSLGCTRWKD